MLLPESSKMNVTCLLSPSDDHCPDYTPTIHRHVFFFCQPPQRKYIVDSRRVFTDEQQRILELEYAKEPYPSLSRRKEIAQRIDTTLRRVQIWFQNKRQRRRGVTEAENAKYNTNQFVIHLLVLLQTRVARKAVSTPYLTCRCRLPLQLQWMLFMIVFNAGTVGVVNDGVVVQQWRSAYLG
ncbi:putative homeobox protein [Planoprotostelium fungivorum]|uniref:Putative homeobox protein n=1 Tax=Planoprotostelium fungivorum TaxID=1890364 RepID=A0A2P6MWK3_9EUKA|nr:putative homeobox protein [Planoprotostelium fungivorum]